MRDYNSEKTDEEIAALAQSDDIEFFGVLVDRYEKKIKRYGKKFLSDKEEIKDVVQEVFIKAYRNIQGFDSDRKFSSWLYRIAHNELVNVLRKKKKILPLSLLDLDTFLPQKYENNNIEDNIEKERTKEIISKCIEDLDIKYKEPIILYYFEELGYKEIADIMQIPVSTVGIRIKRAKEKMKKIYEKIKQ